MTTNDPFKTFKLLVKTSNIQILHPILFILYPDNYPVRGLHVVLHDGFAPHLKQSDGALWEPVPLNPGLTPWATTMPLLTELGFVEMPVVVVEF
jgi:hypothetical protein